MNSTPSAEILERAVIRPQHPGALHQQVRQFLREAIDEHFEDGQSFWTEMLLMEKLGVSRGTVRQALGELTKEGLLVREATRRTFVRKSALAVIGLVLRRYQSDTRIELMQRVAAACLERGLRLELYPIVHEDQLQTLAETIRHAPGEERLILLGTHRQADQFLQECLAARGYRTVALEAMKGSYRGASVSTDGAAAVRLAVGHLRELGHQRITFMVNEPADRLPVKDKIREFERLVEEYDLDGQIVTGAGLNAQGSFDVGYATMPLIWDGARRPTAIFTASDPGAWAALRWLAERDIKVPAQFSVVGFEGVKPDAFTHPPLTTVAHEMDALVQRAFELLEQPGTSTQQERLAPSLIVRNSTGPAPTSI